MAIPAFPLPPPHRSWVQVLAELPEAERNRLLTELGLTSLTDLLANWRLLARREQLPPPGHWSIWLILAGRGFGKTFAGANWLIEQHRYPPPGPRAPTGIVAATNEDLKRYCIRGPSGILAQAPADFYPKYEPHNSRLLWPDGSETLIFSSEKPERLRGPNLRGVWCLVGETLITMADGRTRPIRDVRAGNLVTTRFGPRRVLAQAMTHPNAELYRLTTSTGQQLIGTGDHPILTKNRSFVPLAELTNEDILCELPLNMAERSGPVDQMDITCANLRTAFFIASSTETTMGPFHRVMSSTISMATRRITIPTISLQCHLPSTPAFISWAIRETTTQLLRLNATSASKNIGRGWNQPTIPVMCAGPNLPVEHMVQDKRPPSSVLDTVWKHTAILLLRARFAPVTIARRVISRLSAFSAFVAGIVAAPITTLAGAVRKLPSLSIAGNARLSLSPNGQTTSSVLMPVAASGTRKISPVSVERLPRPAPVYDLQVEDAAEFVANGLVVHNCDELCSWTHLQECWDNLEFSLRASQEPRVTITTTPKPRALLKQLVNHSLTVITGGSTFDNAANLAPPFLERMRERYANTTLGEQELYARILDEAKGALWHRQLIESTRIRRSEVPDLARIVVGVDPGHIAGIVVAGVADGTGYVLRDATTTGSPDHWGRAAVLAWRDEAADTIIVEKNHGGEMAESVLKGVAKDLFRAGELPSPHVPIRTVWASRGKYARAEPVSSLYEQGRVRHAGSFPELEDELCTWVPDEGQPSPNRLDACLIAGTLVKTNRGQVPIEEVTTHDYVLTRKGYYPVTWAGLTKQRAIVTTLELANGQRITGTAEHPVYIPGRGFVPINDIVIGDSLCTREIALNLRELSMLDTLTIQQSISIDTITRPEAVERAFFIERFGKRPMAIFQRAIKSIIKMVIRSTIAYPILSWLPQNSTLLDMPMSFGSRGKPMQTRLDLLLRPGTALMRDEDGTASMQSNNRKEVNQAWLTVLTVADRILERLRVVQRGLFVAPVTGDGSTQRASIQSRSNAPFVISRLPGQNTSNDLKHALVSVVRRYENSKPQPVYNLHVNGPHEFYANGLLVHNCVWALTDTLVKGRVPLDAGHRAEIMGHLSMSSFDAPTDYIDQAPAWRH